MSPIVVFLKAVAWISNDYRVDFQRHYSSAILFTSIYINENFDKEDG